MDQKLVFFIALILLALPQYLSQVVMKPLEYQAVETYDGPTCNGLPSVLAYVEAGNCVGKNLPCVTNSSGSTRVRCPTCLSYPTGMGVVEVYSELGCTGYIGAAAALPADGKCHLQSLGWVNGNWTTASAIANCTPGFESYLVCSDSECKKDCQTVLSSVCQQNAKFFCGNSALPANCPVLFLPYNYTYLQGDLGMVAFILWMIAIVAILVLGAVLHYRRRNKKTKGVYQEPFLEK